jgi:hypothetical protein
MNTTQAERQEARTEEKKKVFGTLDEALQEANESDSARGVRAAIELAERAVKEAEQLVAAARKKAEARDHNSEDEDIYVELRIFLNEVQRAANKVRELADRRGPPPSGKQGQRVPARRKQAATRKSAAIKKRAANKEPVAPVGRT